MQESKNFSAMCLLKFSMDFDAILYAVETCWSAEPHCISSNNCAREINQVSDLS